MQPNKVRRVRSSSARPTASSSQSKIGNRKSKIARPCRVLLDEAPLRRVRSSSARPTLSHKSQASSFHASFQSTIGNRKSTIARLCHTNRAPHSPPCNAKRPPNPRPPHYLQPPRFHRNPRPGLFEENRRKPPHSPNTPNAAAALTPEKPPCLTTRARPESIEGPDP